MTTAPDYRGNRTELRMLTRAVGPGDRVAIVDDASAAVAEAVPVLVGFVDGSTLDDG